MSLESHNKERTTQYIPVDGKPCYRCEMSIDGNTG